MHRAWVVVILALTGCDVVFGLEGDDDPGVEDARPRPDEVADMECVLINCLGSTDTHDEDGDCIPDACDPCPFVAEPQEDLDGDGVGAACEENDQALSKQAFLSFHTTDGVTVRPEPGTWAIEDDAFLATGATQYAFHPVANASRPYVLRARLRDWRNAIAAGVLFNMSEPSPTASGYFATLVNLAEGRDEIAIKTVSGEFLTTVRSFPAVAGDVVDIEVIVGTDRLDVATYAGGQRLGHTVFTETTVFENDTYSGVLSVGEGARFSFWHRAERQ